MSDNLGWRASAKLLCINLPMLHYRRRKTYIIRLLLLVAFLGWAAYCKNNAQAESGRQAVTELLECMNGKARWISEDGYDVGCMPAQINRRSK